MRKPTEEELDNYLEDTHAHIKLVQNQMNKAIIFLKTQSVVHDRSKFTDEEAEIYAVVTPEFAKYDYGTPEHKAVGDKLGPAWEHHLENNPHHPEYHENGVDGMDLLYIIEMLCDWKAASMRNPNQDFKKSLQLNLDKKKIAPQLQSIMINTAARLGMLD